MRRTTPGLALVLTVISAVACGSGGPGSPGSGGGAGEGTGGKTSETGGTTVLGGATGSGSATGAGGATNPLCAEHLLTKGGRCEVSSVSCDATDPCPASWTVAQATTTCGASANQITIGACGALRAWKTSFGSPPLFMACYYDPTDGHLAGILHTSDTDAYCGNRAIELSYGDSPPSCAPDPTALTYSCH